MKAVRYFGATDEEANKLLERTDGIGRGSCTLTLLPGRKNLLGIKPEWLGELKHRSDTKKNPFGDHPGVCILSLGISQV